MQVQWHSTMMYSIPYTRVVPYGFISKKLKKNLNQLRFRHVKHRLNPFFEKYFLAAGQKNGRKTFI